MCMKKIVSLGVLLANLFFLVTTGVSMRKSLLIHGSIYGRLD